MSSAPLCLSPFSALSAHDVAAIFRCVAADVLGAQDACALRSTCRLAVRGYDCAAHAGWIPLSGHRADDAAEEGATCDWVSGWFPMRLRRHRDDVPSGGSTPPPPNTTPQRPFVAPVVLRVEHVLDFPLHKGNAGGGLWFPAVTEIAVCETLQRQLVGSPSFPDRTASIVVTAGPARATTRLRVGAVAGPDGDLALAVGPFSVMLHSRTKLRGLASIAHSFGHDVRGCGGFGTLTCVDTTNFAGVESIGNHFMASCRALTSFDASGLSSVRRIGDHFLDKAVSLRNFDSAGLTAVESFGSFCLNDCSSLTSADMRGLTALQSVGVYFMSTCVALTTFDTAGLTSLVRVGDGFLSGSKALTAFDTTPLTALTDAGKHFMPACAALTAFDTSGLTALTRIGVGSFCHCLSLVTFDPSGLTSLTKLEKNVLRSCPALTSVDLTGLAARNEAAAKLLLAECPVIADLAHR